MGGATPDPMGPSSVKSDRGGLFSDPLSAPPHSVTSVNAGTTLRLTSLNSADSISPFTNEKFYTFAIYE